MKYLYRELKMSASDILQVTLDKDTCIKLIDPPNYIKYRSGKDYHCYSGLITTSPSYLSVPHAGLWHVVLDLGGYSPHMRASVEVIQRK